MEVRPDILLIILGTALVTFIPRVLPLMVLTRLQLPEWFMRWLSYVPISVMAALIAQELFLDGNRPSLAGNRIELLAAVPTFLVAIRTKSLLATVVTGILAVMALRFFG